MGFLSSSEIQDGKHVLDTIRANAKKGIFSAGAADFGDKKMQCSFLGFKKLGNVTLFPFEPEKNTEAKKPKSTTLLFLKKNNKAFSMLVRTYNVGQFELYASEVEAYNSENKTNYDISDFNVELVWKKNPKKTDYYVIEFRWGSVNGKTSRYKIDGETVDGFEPNFLSKEDLIQNEEVSKNLGLPLDICREYVRWNMDNGESVLKTEYATMYVYAAAVILGFTDKENAKRLLEKDNENIKFLSDVVKSE